MLDKLNHKSVTVTKFDFTDGRNSKKQPFRKLTAVKLALSLDPSYAFSEKFTQIYLTNSTAHSRLHNSIH